MKNLIRISAAFISLLHFTAFAQLTPPGFDGGCTNCLPNTNVFVLPYVPGLKLSIPVPLGGTNLPINLLEADPAGTYDIYYASNADSSGWTDVFQGTNGQTNFSLDLSQTGTGFFRASRTDTPITNAANMTISFSNNYVNTNLFIATISGGPAAALAILVNDTNFADARWIPFSSSPYVLLGTNDGTYDVWFGLRGSDGQVFWTMYPVTLQTTPRTLVITNPAAGVVSQPVIQLQGYSPEGLSSISYDLTNMLGLTTNQPVMITSQFYDTNSGNFSTNYFQAFDVPLFQGTNTITIHATDLAGNTTTTNFNLMVDYSTRTNPPVVQLFWPQDGTQISGTNFTLRGWVSDPTAKVNVQAVDMNGNTNVLAGTVGRDGMFWVKNLPLANGTNNMALSVVDVAGNTTVSNINVISSSVALTIDDVQTAQTTVTGTIDTTNYAIWVNGVLATQNGGGGWEADNVPTLLTNGTVQVRIIPYSDNGGNGSGSDTNAISNSDLDNPSSSQAVDMEVVIPPPSGTYIEGFANSLNIQNQGATYSDLSFTWQNGMGGMGIDHQADGSYITTTSPPSFWPQPMPLVTERLYDVDNNLTGTTHRPIPISESHIDSSYINPSGWAYQEFAQAEEELATGGDTGSTEQNLWVISANATAYLNPGSPSDEIPWDGVETNISVPPQKISIGNLGNLDTNGNLYVTLPDNVNIDVTPRVAGANYYTFDVTATKHTSGPCTVSVHWVDDAIEPTIIPDSFDCSVQNDDYYGQDGHFEFTRTGDLQRPLTVAFSIGGTAINGDQYADGRKPFVHFDVGQSNFVWSITPIFYGILYGSASVDFSILPDVYGLNPAPAYSIDQTNATLLIHDTDGLLWLPQFSFPSNGVVQGTGLLCRKDYDPLTGAGTGIGHGPAVVETWLVTDAQLGTNFTFDSTLTAAAMVGQPGFWINEGQIQLRDDFGHITKLYVYGILEGFCISWLDNDGNPVDQKFLTPDPYTITMLPHSSGTFWVFTDDPTAYGLPGHWYGSFMYGAPFPWTILSGHYLFNLSNP